MQKSIRKLIAVLLVMMMSFSALPINTFALKEEAYIFTVEDACKEGFYESEICSASLYADVRFSGNFGNQLSGIAKEIYSAFVENYCKNKSTSAFTLNLKTPLTFTAEIKNGAIVENDEFLEVRYMIASSVQMARDAFVYDYPEIYWISVFSFVYSFEFKGYMGNFTGSISNLEIRPREIYAGASDSVSQYDAAVEDAVYEIRSSLDDDAERTRVLKAIHDYICNNAYYNLVNNTQVHSSAAFFIGDGGVVCEGYSKSFKVLCDRFNIPCVLVSGTADTDEQQDAGHMWNYVQMEDGKWYLVDVTWDDQAGKIYDTYFLANSNSQGFYEKICDERRETNDFSASGYTNLIYPELSSTAYDYHIHQWESDYTVDKEPTCTKQGSKSIHCTSCSLTKDTTVVESLGHSWDSWKQIVSPTCTQEGKLMRSCLRCTETEERSVMPLNHQNSYDAEGKDASCTESGYTAGVYCPDCKIWISGHEVIKELGHKFANYKSDNNATCEKDGTKTAECDVCGESQTVTDEGSRLEHSWSEWKETKAPLCTEKGEEARNCAACGEIQMRYTEPSDHINAYNVEAEKASCTKEGYTAGVYCPDCKIWVSGHEATEKTAHTFTEKIVDEAHLVSAATVTSPAVYSFDCSYCDAVSESLTFTYGENLTLGKTEEIKAVQTTSIIQLNWKAVEGAVGYKVYQKTANGWTALGIVSAPAARIVNLAPGNAYSFAVRAGAIANGKVIWSPVYTVINTATQAPAPAVVKAKQNNTAIQLLWNSCAGATGYRIYVYEDSSWIVLGQVKGVKATLTNLVPGKKYTYAVRPYIITESGVVWGNFTIYTAATVPLAPETAAVSAASGKITVKWSAVEGAEVYQLYYKTGNGGYKLYKNYNGAQTVSFSSLKSGTKYTFAVRAAVKTSGGWIYGSFVPVNVTVK